MEESEQDQMALSAKPSISPMNNFDVNRERAFAIYTPNIFAYRSNYI